MDYKAPPQYSTPPPGQAYSPPAQAYPPQAHTPGQPQYGTPPAQYGTPQPQYGGPVPQQHLVQQQQQPHVQQQYPPQHLVQQHPQQLVQQHPQQAIQQQPPQQQPQARAVAQYQGQAPMQAGGAAPANGSDWSNSVMDCSPCGTCLLGTYLPCVLLGNTADRMRDPTMQTADTMNSDCLVFMAIHCFTGCGWIYIMMKRTEIRERFGIQGDGTADCCTAYWCPCCSLIQQEKEVKLRTQHLVPNNQGYQAQPGMVMPQK